MPEQRNSLPGPDDILRQALPNGITVLVRENWSAPSVVVEGYLMAGNLDEPEELVGLASFTTSMLSRGTYSRTFAEISEMIESVGASIGFSVDRHTVSFSAKSLAEDLPLVLDVLADELRHPSFPAEYIERLRGQRLTAIAERENDTRQMAGLTFRELMYGSHPLGRDLLGTRESNALITRDAIRQFYDRCVSPDGMVVVVVGAISANAAVAQVNATLGDWCGSRPVRPQLPPLPPVTTRRDRKAVMPDKSQTDLVVGWPSMRRLDPDFDAARLANTVLGVFGMMGRLGESVREEQGLAYYAYSRLRADREPGTWLAVAGVDPDDVEQALAAILQEVRRLREEPVSSEELEDSKRYLVGSLPLQLETNDGVASIIADLEWHQLGLDYLERYAGIIANLSPEMVQAAAERYLDPERYVLAIAGP